MAGVFTVVSLLLCGLVAGAAWFALKRRRRARLSADERAAVGGAGAGGAGHDRFGDEEFENPFNGEEDHHSNQGMGSFAGATSLQRHPEMSEQRQSMAGVDANGRSILPGMAGYSLPLPVSSSNHYVNSSQNGSSNSRDGHESGGSRGSHELLNADRNSTLFSQQQPSPVPSSGYAEWMMGQAHTGAGSLEGHREREFGTLFNWIIDRLLIDYSPVIM